ncbi:MAG: 3-dehydroquinate synthase II [bacterium]|nr:3-dehydroquinate synthase II [bacterium]
MNSKLDDPQAGAPNPKLKRVWVKVVPWKKEIVTCALESGVEAVLVPDGYTSKVKELGIIKTIAGDGDIKLGEDVVEFEINSKEDEEEAVRLSKSRTLILKMKDWTIIPLENLIAQTEGLIVEVNTAEEARTALQILEKGVDGILLSTTDLNEIKECMKIVQGSLQITLTSARISKIKPLGMGDRVCIDTCTNMTEGEGILVGNSSSAMFLVHSESISNPYVEPRPFRVNAGGVHAYTLTPEGRTKYLSELKSGDEVLILNYQGKAELAICGRAKVERRPLMLVEAEAGGKIVSLVLQNAETIRLTTPQGKAVSIVNLKEGDEVLAYTEEAGRHFGIKVKETIVEK